MFGYRRIDARTSSTRHPSASPDKMEPIDGDIRPRRKRKGTSGCARGSRRRLLNAPFIGLPFDRADITSLRPLCAVILSNGGSKQSHRASYAYTTRSFCLIIIIRSQSRTIVHFLADARTLITDYKNVLLAAFVCLPLSLPFFYKYTSWRNSLALLHK